MPNEISEQKPAIMSLNTWNDIVRIEWIQCVLVLVALMKRKRWSSFEYCVMNLNGAIQWKKEKKTEHKRSILSSSNLSVSPVWHTSRSYGCHLDLRFYIAQCFRWFHTKSSPQQQNNNVFSSSSRHSYTHVFVPRSHICSFFSYLLSFLHFNRMKYARILAESLFFFHIRKQKSCVSQNEWQ